MTNLQGVPGLGHGPYTISQNDPSARPTSRGSPHGHLDHYNASLIRDEAGWLPASRHLSPADVILLLTPVVAPLYFDETRSDPFEPLGRALAARHSRVRHVPYTNGNGITSTHVGFLVRANLIIFVICRPLHENQESQLQYAQVARMIGGQRPLILVVCCNTSDLIHLDQAFPAVVQSQGYSAPALEATAALIFGETEQTTRDTPRRDTPDSQGLQPHSWKVEQWDEVRDTAQVFALWEQSMGAQFAINAATLAGLLSRPGYARHYVVRDTANGEALGFCATYLSYADQAGEKLIASLALLFVRMSHQRQGIGLSLHNFAINQLRRTRGVVRIQLGSTFPRILYGPPHDMHSNSEWFRRRGWQMDEAQPGQGQSVYDMILDFRNWQPSQVFDSLETTVFRVCTQNDMHKVLQLVEHESSQGGKMGWFDQYSRLVNDVNIKDIIIGLEGNSIVAAALTYTPSCGSPVAADLPWASQIGDDVGGVTCICIPAARRETLTTSFLDACVHKLQLQGMRRMFADGISTRFEEFRALGFQPWAQYRDVWREAEVWR